MRVLLVTHYYAEHRGGVEIVASALAQRLVRLPNLDIVWIASDEKSTSVDPEIVRQPVPAWNVAERRLGFPYPLWGPITLWRLGRAVRSCDIVHLHDSLYLGNVISYIWARYYRKKVVVTQHVGPIPYKSRLLRGLLGLANRTLARFVLGGSDQVVFISARVEKYFTRLVRFGNPPLYIPNGVDTARFQPADEDTRLALRTRFGWAAERKVRLFVGRFVEKKGLPLLRSLAANRPQDLWVFIGWGPNDPATWGLSNVTAVGTLAQERIVDYYHAADLLVLPSLGEGFPLVVQEAMACGLPALISPETLEGAPDAAGIIASADLTTPAWNEALTRIDNGPSQRERVTEFSRRWDWDLVAQSYAQIFESLVLTV